MRSTRRYRFVIDLNPQHIFVHLGLTDSSFSVLPSHQVDLGFSISMQPTRTFWSHRVAVTACSFASRCHRVVPLGHTDRVRLYILTGQILENFPKPFTRAEPALPLRVSGSSSRRQRPPAAGLRRRQQQSAPPLPPWRTLAALG